MANYLLLYFPSSRMSAFFAVLLCYLTRSASSSIIDSAPMAMNVTLGSVVSISCSSPDTSAFINLAVPGAVLSPTNIITDDLKTTSALFTATANLNGTTMRCTVTTSGGEPETSEAVTLLIQGPPSAPSNPAYQEIDPCSKKITWMPPFTLDGVPLFFNITITIASTQEVVDYASTEDAEYILSPLDLTETYIVNITAWNAAGSSSEVTLEVNFATEGFIADCNGFGRDGVTWILNFTAMNICMSQAITNANIKLCSESGEEQCDIFSAPKENIEQFVEGKLRLSFPVHVQDQIMYNSMLYVHYESGQELHSLDSFPIDTADILNVDVSSKSDGIACFNVTQIPGSLLYGMVVQFVDTRNGNSITRVVVVNDDDESVCIEDLPRGNYSVSVGDLEAPLLSVAEEVAIEAESTTITTCTTSTEASVEDPSVEDPSCPSCQSYLVAAIAVSIVILIGLLLLIIFVVACLIWLKHLHNKNEKRNGQNGPSILLDNRISALFQRDNKDHAGGALQEMEVQVRHVESDGIQLKSVVPVETDPDEKVSKPIQVSERERSPHSYKPSV